MLDWIKANWPTLLVLLAVAAAVGFAVFSIVRKKLRGGSSCSCGCSGCAAGGSCKKNK